jgi:sec-independent protein translocase protein TatC
MTIVEHLEELRRRLLLAFAALGAGTAVGFLFVDHVLNYLIHMIGVERLVFLAPAEAFLIRLRIALFTGVFVGLPVILYQLWAFVAVGLTRAERRTVMLLLPPSLVLFAGGAAFGLFVIMPLGLRILLSYQTEALQPLLAVGPTLSFVMLFIIAFGFVFQVPIIVLLLARFGVVSPETLVATRRYAIALIVVVSAVLTPPDPLTLFLMGIPMYALYEVSVWLARLIAPKPHARIEPVIE